MRITFEKYVERMGKPLKQAAKQKAGNHPYLGEDDLFQEALLAIWTVWNKHRRKMPFENLCKVGWRAGIRKMITQKDRSKCRGEGVAKWVDMSGLLMIGSVALKDGRPINRGNTSEYEHDRVFVKLAVRAIEKTLSDDGRSLLGELLAPGERTLRAVRELWTNRSSRNTPFWRIEPNVYARSLGVPNDVAKGLLAEIRWKFDVYFQSVGLSMVEGNGGNSNRGGIEMLEKEFVTDPLEFNGGGEEPEPEPEPEPEAGEEEVVDLDEGESAFEEPGTEGFGEGPAEETGEKEEQSKEEKPKAKKAEKPKAEKPKAEKPEKKKAEKPKAEKPEKKKESKSVAKRKEVQKREPYKKAEKKAAPKAKKTGVKTRAAVKTFREGTQAARVWALLEKRFDAGKTIQKVDVASAYRKACKFDEERAAGSASLFMWDMLRKGLTKKVGPGEFARKKG